MELLQELERGVAVLRHLRLVAVRVEEELDRAGERLLVVDDEDGKARHQAAGTASVTDAGSVIVTTVPSRSPLTMVRLPAFCSTKRLAIARPSPVPSALVVKNGSETRASALAGIPSPVSRTVTRRLAPPSAPAIRAPLGPTAPPPGMASSPCPITSRP